jgi:hypothetical protein
MKETSAIVDGDLRLEDCTLHVHTKVKQYFF